LSYDSSEAVYERKHGLMTVYGDWTWSKSPFYEDTKAALKRVTQKLETAISPSKLSKASDFKSDEQCTQLHDFTWELSENPALSFEERLKHKQAFFMQGLGKFECLRGRDEHREMSAKYWTKSIFYFSSNDLSKAKSWDPI